MTSCSVPLVALLASAAFFTPSGGCFLSQSYRVQTETPVRAEAAGTPIRSARRRSLAFFPGEYFLRQSREAGGKRSDMTHLHEKRVGAMSARRALSAAEVLPAICHFYFPETPTLLS